MAEGNENERGAQVAARVAAGPFIGVSRTLRAGWSNESGEDNAINFEQRPARGVPSRHEQREEQEGNENERGWWRKEKRTKRSGGYPRGFEHRGHVCIIRDKPITARNACQAVKRYPGPQPGGLMISLGKLDHPRPSSLFSFPSPPPSPPRLLSFASTSFHVFFIHSPRETHYHCAHCYPLSPGGQLHPDNATMLLLTTRECLITVMMVGNVFRLIVSLDRFWIFRAERSRESKFKTIETVSIVIRFLFFLWQNYVVPRYVGGSICFL